MDSVDIKMNLDSIFQELQTGFDIAPLKQLGESGSI